MSYLPFMIDFGAQNGISMGNGMSVAPEMFFEALHPSVMEYFPRVPKYNSVRKISKDLFEVCLNVEDDGPDNNMEKTNTLYEALDTSALEYFPKVPKYHDVRKPSKDRFELYLDIEDYGPDDIRVKTIGGFVVIEAQHKEKLDGQGWVQRQFKRRCPIPKGYKTEGLLSQYCSDGSLTITANLVKIDESDDRSDMPIKEQQENDGKASDEELDQPEPDADGNQSEKKAVKPKPKAKKVEVMVEIEDIKSHN